MTNRQRIELMTDKEFAKFLFNRGNGSEYCYGICAYQDECDSHYSHADEFCISQIVKWLNKEEEGLLIDEAQSDMRDYCERYEPTYNPDDGSM